MRQATKTLPGTALVLLGAAVLVLSGCGGGGDKTVTVSRTVTAGATTSSTTQGTTGATGETGTTPSEPPTKIVRRPSFKSPTGNIGCMMIGGVARCDIDKRDWPTPPRPAGCPKEVDFGQGLEVGRSGKGEIVCAGDTARDPSAPKLAYGTGSQVGAFVCVSRPGGVTCTNRNNGHGFLVNIQRYGVF